MTKPTAVTPSSDPNEVPEVAQNAPATNWVAETAQRLRVGDATRSHPKVRDEAPFDLGRGAYFDLLERHLQELRLEAMTQRRLVDQLLLEVVPDGPEAEKEREALRRKLKKSAYREAVAVLREDSQPLDAEMLSSRWRRVLREERGDLLLLLAWLGSLATIIAAVSWVLIRFT